MTTQKDFDKAIKAGRMAGDILDDENPYITPVLRDAWEQGFAETEANNPCAYE